MSRNSPAKMAFRLGLACLLLSLALTSSCLACFAIVVGKDASADGCILVAHNEDDRAPQIVNHYKVPRKTHAPGEKVTLRNGGALDQAPQTWSYIRSEMPGMLFSDGYINEWGVTVTSNNCPSREDKPTIADGGIGYMLRRLVAERATSARKGVLLAGRLVERFGYIDSGRTYTIADPNEGWFFCVVNGKHWLAKRVPDDQVAMLSNTYAVRHVDLSDPNDCLACPDIIDYAAARGWHDKNAGRPFDFAATYASAKSASSRHNLDRQRAGLTYLSQEPIAPDAPLPFSIKPHSKVGVTDLIHILRHDNNVKLVASRQQAACDIVCAICSGNTQTSFVAQLRQEVPRDIGIVYWVCLASPSTSVYIPFHFGIEQFPQGFAAESARPSAEFFRDKVSAPFRSDPLQAFWTFANFRDKLAGAPPDMLRQTRTEAERIESRAVRLQQHVETAALAGYADDRGTAIGLLSNYSLGIYHSALEAMNDILSPKSVIGAP